MMPLHPERSIQEKADEAFMRTYHDAIGHLNRAERRTAFGRQKVAEAHAKALQAKVDLLEEELRFLKGGAACN